MRAWSVVPLAKAIRGLTGWRRNLAAYVFGVCATLTLAPFYLFILILPAYSGLLWLLDGAPSRKRMFLDGWWWGWGFYMTGLYWFCVALLTDPEKFGWLIPPTLFGLTAVIALYPAIACWLMSWLRIRGLTKIMVFTIVWTGVEYARGHLFTGFPWNLPGYSIGFSDASLQMASVVGIYGLSWLTLLLGTSPVALGLKKRGPIYACVIWGIFALGTLWGVGRLHQANAIPEDERYVPGIMIRVVQANVTKPNNWDPKRQLDGLKEYVNLTRSPGLDKVTHILWPESAVPFLLSKDAPITHKLGDILPPGKILVTGTLRSEGEGGNWQVWNSLMAIDHKGQIIASYDKIHLVPFGEFVPFRNLFPKTWLTPAGAQDFSIGHGGTLLDIAGLPPLLPLICYEVIFPELSAPDTMHPQMLLSITNDVWFGSSSGPYQDFQMARMRAVEQGVPLVRAANTGISALVDSFGQVVSSMPLGYKGFMDVKLPIAFAGNTIYRSIYKEFTTLLIVFAVSLILWQRSKADD